jgi:YrbI family 3-deoxy-D-manno-octulosonate 8-phosphate phosphatase
MKAGRTVDRSAAAFRRNLKQIAHGLRLVVFDFDGVFTDDRVLAFQDGTEGIWCHRGDGYGIRALEGLGVKMLVISAEQNPVITARCKKLGLRCIQGCKRKADMLRREANCMGIPFSAIAYLGNDIDDIECLRLVGLPACVRGSCPDVVRAAALVTERRGGEGAVREFCEHIAEQIRYPRAVNG